MIATLLLLLTQTPPAPENAGERPVRVWLGSTSPLVRGAPVRVFVQTSEDGDLIVLRARTDGRIQVLFPSDPTAEPFVRAGTYEIRKASDGEAFVVLEPDGTGMVLAALSPGPLRLDEFVRQADWNPDALAPSWPEADREGALTDLVQRMLGDGYFNYDFVTYTVAPAAPPSYALEEGAPLAPELPTCLGCSFVDVTLFVPDAVVGCDPLFASCFGFPIAPRHTAFCGSQVPCSDRGPGVAVVGASVVPLFSRSAQSILRGRFIPRTPRFLLPPRPRSITVIGPRIRVPDQRPRERATATVAAPVGARRRATGSFAPVAIQVRNRPVSGPVNRPVRVVRPWVAPSSGGGPLSLTGAGSGTVPSTGTVVPLTGAGADGREPVREETRRARSVASSGLVAVPRGAAPGSFESPASPVPSARPASPASAAVPLPARSGFSGVAARPQAVAQPLLPLRASPGTGAAGPMRALAPTGAVWQGVVGRSLRTAGRRH